MHRTVVTNKEDWETPFGLVKVNGTFITKLMEKCDFVKESDIGEHAIEVQLPFLQYVNKDRLKDITFVPLIVPSSENYMELGEAIAEIDEDVCVIASSDMTHFGPGYGYVPFTSDIKENLYKQDNEAVSYIKKLDAKGFLAYRQSTGATICGAYAIAVAIEVVKNLFAKKGDLLMYYTSGDVLEDYNNAVGYAAVAFR
jgi:AmmeMemoRadiSam system protein B